MVVQGFVLLMLLYYSKEEAQEIRAQGWRTYFTSIWNVFDVVNILLLIALGVTRVLTSASPPPPPPLLYLQRMPRSFRLFLSRNTASSQSSSRIT